MRPLFYVLSSLVVILLAAWAYQENFRTQSALRRGRRAAAGDRPPARGARRPRRGVGLADPARPAARPRRAQLRPAGAHAAAAHAVRARRRGAVPARAAGGPVPAGGAGRARGPAVTRTPLRPLARILAARSRGENPDAIERENRRLRHESLRDRERQRAESRIVVLAVFFLAAFALVGVRMGVLAASEPERAAWRSRRRRPISGTRADITDRQGRVLATNLATYSLYAHPLEMVDPVRAATELARIFPELDAADLERDFTDGRKFLWIRKTDHARAAAGGPRHRRARAAVRPARDAALPERPPRRARPGRRELRPRGRGLGRGDRRRRHREGASTTGCATRRWRSEPLRAVDRPDGAGGGGGGARRAA